EFTRVFLRPLSRFHCAHIPLAASLSLSHPLSLSPCLSNSLSFSLPLSLSPVCLPTVYQEADELCVCRSMEIRRLKFIYRRVSLSLSLSLCLSLSLSLSLSVSLSLSLSVCVWVCVCV